MADVSDSVHTVSSIVVNFGGKTGRVGGQNLSAGQIKDIRMAQRG